jgi:hypothetical protein
MKRVGLKHIAHTLFPDPMLAWRLTKRQEISPASKRL